MKTKVIKRGLWVIAAVLLAAFCAFTSIFSGTTVKADSTKVRDYSKTSILDDLSDMDTYLYPANPLGDLEVIRFQEYCYSEKPFFAEYYGLYVYIYNPTEKAIKTDAQNTINIANGYNVAGAPVSYKKVALRYCDKTENNRFYKFKLADSKEQLSVAKAYAAQHEGKRRYDLVEIELTAEDSTRIQSYNYSKTYYFSGLAAGCGETTESESTLACEMEGLETIHLEPYATAYRPEGTNGKNDYTQDSLHSVYFAVPNAFIDKYGEMTAVHATWLNAVLKPGLVTGNQEAFNEIKQHLGENRPDLEYCYVGAYGTHIEDSYYMCGDGDMVYPYDNIPNNKLTQVAKELETLYLLFNSGGSDNSADGFTISSETLQKEMELSATRYGGELINGKYAASIFESVDSEFTEVNITKDESYELTSEVLGPTWWDRFMENTVSSTFDGIKAIYAVSDTDFSGSIEDNCNKLYIGEQDYDQFKAYYEKNKSDSTVYLFRYQVSDYIAQEATLFKAGTITWEEVDTNAYFFQETVNLDFDIIDVTFTKAGVDTVIGVVMSPMDITPGITPPVITTTDWDILGVFIDIILTIASVIIFIGICILLVKLVIFIIKKILNGNDG